MSQQSSPQIAGGFLNPAKAHLAAGSAIGAFMVATPSAALVQVLARSGIDALILDMEHGAIDLATLHAMIAATQGTGTAPLVRVPANEPWLVKPVLDAGAMGINFPLVGSAEEARRTTAAVRYPPAGVRGYAPSFAAARWGVSREEYWRIADREILNIITIETPEAIAALDEILAVPGIDVAAIASFDLSLCLGHPGEFDHPEMRRLVGEAEAKIRRAGIVMAGVALSAEAARAKQAAGYRVLLKGFDVAMLEAAARAAAAF
ncbi:MAG: aldolase/citrate lyase family protein [Rhodospirillales bacterium]|nr:aldolase/citrate lyase family protein [Rhodospirillales bacterium]